MKYSRSFKVLLAIATFWTPAWLVAFVFSVREIQSRIAARQLDAPSWLPFVFGGHVFTILLGLGLLVFYVRHALRNPRLTPGDRNAWAASFLVLGVITMPIYFFKFVSPSRSDQP